MTAWTLPELRSSARSGPVASALHRAILGALRSPWMPAWGLALLLHVALLQVAPTLDSQTIPEPEPPRLHIALSRPPVPQPPTAAAPEPSTVGAKAAVAPEPAPVPVAALAPAQPPKAAPQALPQPVPPEPLAAAQPQVQPQARPAPPLLLPPMAPPLPARPERQTAIKPVTPLAATRNPIPAPEQADAQAWMDTPPPVPPAQVPEVRPLAEPTRPAVPQVAMQQHTPVPEAPIAHTPPPEADPASAAEHNTTHKTVHNAADNTVRNTAPAQPIAAPAQRNALPDASGLPLAEPLVEPPPPRQPPPLHPARFRQPPSPPIYPRAAVRKGEEGTVLVEVELDPEGEVAELRVRESSGFTLLDRAALQTVRKWKFAATHVGGSPIASRVQVPVQFVLR